MDTTSDSSVWRKCTTCKKPIHLGQKYWICSVSTCNRVRTDLVFCDLRCFDAHVPVLNHRDAGAFERKAPLKKESLQPLTEKTTPQKKEVLDERKVSDENEILMVASKVKQYIREQSGMNTSDGVMIVLSHSVRKIANRAIGNAEKNGRKTVLDRDC